MIWPFKPTKPPRELIADLESDDPQVRRKAFTELVQHPDPGTNDLVISALRTMHDAPKELILPLVDIVGKRCIEAGIELLKPLLYEEDPHIKAAALRALSMIPTQATLDLLLPLLADPDLTVRRQIRDTVQRIFGSEALGAIMRAIPVDRNNPLYFELVSLFEEMGFFEELKENFGHPDVEVKKFHFNNLIKFHRPDFIPLFLELAPMVGTTMLTRIENALHDYSPEELLPPFKNALQAKSLHENTVELAEKVLFKRFCDSQEELLGLTLKIGDNRIRTRFVEIVLKKPDPFIFSCALNLLDDPTPRIRAMAAESLTNLIEATFARIANPNESRKQALINHIRDWQTALFEMLFRNKTENQKEFLKVFFTFTQKDHSIIKPLLPRLLSMCFQETIETLITWPFSEQKDFISHAMNQDPSIISLLASGLNKFPHPGLAKILLVMLPTLEKADQDALRRKVAARAASLRIFDFLDDPYPEVRVATLELAMESKPENLSAIIKSKMTDINENVRRTALQSAIRMHPPDLVEILGEAVKDPDPQVALEAAKGLKSTCSTDKLAYYLKKLVGSPIEDLRMFALHEIARITQERYLQNFDKLAPEIRKLAGSAIQKLDSNFTKNILKELKSLESGTRLRAARIMENLQIDGHGKQALMEAMKDPSKKVRAAIVKTLGVLGDKSLMSSLIEYFNDPDERVRANTIEAVSAIGDQAAVQILLPFLEDSNNRIRANAALAVWQIAKANILPILKKMLTHSDPLMKASALWVMGEIGHDNYLQHVIPFLRSNDDIVRLNALKTTAKIKVEMLKPYLDAFRKDPSSDIRRYVAQLSFKVL